MARLNHKCRRSTLNGLEISGCAWLLMLMAAIAPRHAGAAAPSKEYEVKAAFLLNFAQFIQWPAASFPRPDTPFIIGVLGEDPFGAALEQTFQDESVQGRKFVIRRSRRVADMKGCHLVFISKSEKEQIAQILPSLDEPGLVTVSEVDDFVERGGVINFYIDKNKVRFEINLRAAERKGLKISAQLLKRARIVGSNPGREGQ